MRIVESDAVHSVFIEMFIVIFFHILLFSSGESHCKDTAGPGFEPGYSGPKPDVLPLDDPATFAYPLNPTFYCPCEMAASWHVDSYETMVSVTGVMSFCFRVMLLKIHSYTRGRYIEATSPPIFRVQPIRIFVNV